MFSTTNLLVTNYSAMIPMGTGIGRLLAWLLPTHCLHSLGILSPFQRAFRQCVEHVQAMVALPGRLLAFLVPTDCLRSLGNWPSFHRALRQYVGNPEAVCSLYDKVWLRLYGNYAFDFGFTGDLGTKSCRSGLRRHWDRKALGNHLLVQPVSIVSKWDGIGYLSWKHLFLNLSTHCIIIENEFV